MRFAHLSDCHVGGWREEGLKELSVRAFCRAMEVCVEEKVDFVVIAGDLLNSSLPAVEALKEVARALRMVRECGIRVYLVPGSHDFSPSGRTMLDVLERAGLCRSVYRPTVGGGLEFTVDEETGVKLVGMCGLRGGLERLRYAGLEKRGLEGEGGFKVFVFHTLLNELKPARFDQVEGEPVASLPRGFDYYAGGHPHCVVQKRVEGYGVVAYPGPLFPNNFREMEELRCGGFFIVDEQLRMRHVPVELKSVASFRFSAEGKDPVLLMEEMVRALSAVDVRDKIVTVRVEGVLSSGRPSEVDFERVRKAAAGAFVFLKNVSKLSTVEFEEFAVESGSVEDVERRIVEEHCGGVALRGLSREKLVELVLNVMLVLAGEKEEGERVVDFEQRVLRDVAKVVPVEDVWG